MRTRLRLRINTKNARFERRRTQRQLAGTVHRAGTTVEYQLVLAPDTVYVADGQIIRLGALGQQALALGLLLDMKRRGVEVDEHLGTGRLGLGGGPLLPDILTDGHADTMRVQLEYAGRLAGAIMPAFVEHPVVGQALLAVVGNTLTVANHHGGVIDDVVDILGIANDGGNAGQPLGKQRQRGFDGAGQSAPQQQIVRRIAQQCHFRKGHDVGAIAIARGGSGLDHLACIALDIAHPDIELGQCDT